MRRREFMGSMGVAVGGIAIGTSFGLAWSKGSRRPSLKPPG